MKNLFAILILIAVKSQVAFASSTPDPQDSVSVLVGSSIVITQPVFVPASASFETETDVLIQNKARVVYREINRPSCVLTVKASYENRELQPRTLVLKKVKILAFTNWSLIQGFEVEDQGPQKVVTAIQCEHPFQIPADNFDYSSHFPKTVGEFESILNEATSFQLQPEVLIKAELGTNDNNLG